jgi:general L-amino acid transport system permease protein
MPKVEPFVRTEHCPDMPPPSSETGVIHWLRHNLFSSPFNAVLTIGSLYLMYLAAVPLFTWAFVNADWTSPTNIDKACQLQGGACWSFVVVRFNQFMYGFYPHEARWRVDTGFVIFVILLAALMIERVPYKKYTALFLIFVYPILAYFLFFGGAFLEEVDTEQWGGLFLTLVLAIIPIAVSLPLGTLLALGRRSEMPIIRTFCICLIELPRGVPLITVLFMSSVVLPLFLPPGTFFDKVLRVLVGMSFFAAAYMAETVRGGLQAIPRGQYEAAQALGLSYWKMMGFVILPQALKIMIPGIVSSFIGLFKDTTLVVVVGLFDMLNMIGAASAHSNWLGTDIEGYVFAALVYWIFCFGMSRYSIYLEHKLHTGH